MLSFPLGTLTHYAALNGAGDEVVPPLASPVQTRSRRFAGHPLRTLTLRGNGVGAPPSNPLYIGAAGAAVVYRGATAATAKYLGPRSLF
jgi:hypothetical protein